MNKIIKLSLTTLLLVLSFSFIVPHAADAVNVFQNCGANPDTEVCRSTNDKLFGPGGFWNNILNTLTFIIGAVSVLMIVIGGLRYTLSNGDAKGTSAAKDTIIYAIVGLIIAVMANAIVNFVLTNI
jgi:hypothetical protein